MCSYRLYILRLPFIVFLLGHRKKTASLRYLWSHHGSDYQRQNGCGQIFSLFRSGDRNHPGMVLKPVINHGINSTTKPQLVNCLAGINSMLWLVSPLVSFWVSTETTLSVGVVMGRLRPFGCWPDSRHELLGWRHAMEIRLPETSIISIISPWKSMFGRWVSFLEQCLLTGAMFVLKEGVIFEKERAWCHFEVHFLYTKSVKGICPCQGLFVETEMWLCLQLKEVKETAFHGKARCWEFWPMRVWVYMGCAWREGQSI